MAIVFGSKLILLWSLLLEWCVPALDAGLVIWIHMSRFVVRQGFGHMTSETNVAGPLPRLPSFSVY